jgi:hypothetical protein
MPRGWIEDDLPELSDDGGHLELGDAWSSVERDDKNPTYRHPIGYMRRKPVVRIKAWTVPIISVATDE